MMMMRLNMCLVLAEGKINDLLSDIHGSDVSCSWRIFVELLPFVFSLLLP